jgi:FMN phosphatase YigB (HAD superfamily)
VGDRIDNDIVPAARAGMVAHSIVRGPWAAIQKDWPEAELAATQLDQLGSNLPV